MMHLDGAVTAVEGEGHEGAAVHGAADGCAIDARDVVGFEGHRGEVVEIRILREMTPKRS